MTNPTVAKIIKEIQLRYDAPRTVAEADRKDRLLLLADDLEKFDEALLVKIWERFPGKYRFSKWPTISDIQKVADDVSIPSSPTGGARKKPKPEDPDEQFARGQLRSPEARRAAEEGFAAGFYDWCAKHKTVPTPEDMEAIKASSLRLRAKAREKAESGMFLGKTLLDNMEGREKSVARLIREPAGAS